MILISNYLRKRLNDLKFETYNEQQLLKLSILVNDVNRFRGFKMFQTILLSQNDLFVLANITMLQRRYYIII